MQLVVRSMGSDHFMPALCIPVYTNGLLLYYHIIITKTAPQLPIILYCTNQAHINKTCLFVCAVANTSSKQYKYSQIKYLQLLYIMLL